MSVRLTPRGSILFTFDDASDRWVTTKGMVISVLSQYVEIEPGTTLGHVFEMVDSDPELKQFLAHFCGCDIDVLHGRPREGGEPLEVPTAMEPSGHGGYQFTQYEPADCLIIRPNFYAYTDMITGDRRLEGHHMLGAGSSRHDGSWWSIPQHRDVSFGFLCGLELRLDSRFDVVESDDDKQGEGDQETIAFSATVQYTLLEVLLVVYRYFGQPPHDTRTQREIDEDLEHRERMRVRWESLIENAVTTSTLPAFDADGDLPPGVYPATLAEVLGRLGSGSQQRRTVADRLRRIYLLAVSTRRLARFVVFGSFVTAKPDPNDVDIVMLMEDSFDLSTVTGEASLVFQHQEADTHFGASIFWSTRSGAFGGEQAMIEYWQMRRDGGRRGIVEIVEVL